MAFTPEELELLQNVSESLKYVPILYKEVILSANTDTSHHYIKHKIGTLDFNSLLFFIPLSFDESNDTQYIKLLQPGEGFSISSTNIKTYKVMYEKTTAAGNTTYEDAKGQHLRTLRLYILRMISDNEVVIVNYQDTDVVNFTNAEFVTARFTSMPTITLAGEDYTFVKSNDFIALTNRVAALERKIVVNTQAPEEALAQEDEGTIYVKVEEY